MSRTYKFRTPSNQLITIDDKYTYRDIITIGDLKYLFAFKNRLYSIEMFEIAQYNNMTKQNDILNLDSIIDTHNIDTYEIIHVFKERNPDIEIEFKEIQITTIENEIVVEDITTENHTEPIPLEDRKQEMDSNGCFNNCSIM
jgi:hypothetical protein